MAPGDQSFNGRDWRAQNRISERDRQRDLQLATRQQSRQKVKGVSTMRRLACALTLCFACLVAWTGEANAQRGVDWMTSNGDAQRSAWVRADAKISKESIQDQKRKQGFQFLWKLKLNNKPRQLNSLTPPATLERLIGYRGFRMLGFVGGSSDAIFTIDTDLGDRK